MTPPSSHLRRAVARTLFGVEALSADDVEAAIALTRTYELDPALDDALARHPDASVARSARARIAVRAHVDHARLAEASPIFHALAARSVPALLLKGPAMVASGIIPPGTRHARDLDLLVAPNHLPVVRDALTDAGARHPAWVDWPGFDGRPLRTSLLAKDHADLPWVLPGGLTLDLHGALPGRPADAAYDLPVLLRDARPATLHGLPVLVPSLEHQRFILCEHAGPHHAWEPRHLSRHTSDLLRLGLPPRPGRRVRARPLSVPRAAWLHHRLVHDLRAWAHGSDAPPHSLAHAFLADHPLFERPRALTSTLARWADDLVRRPEVPFRKLWPHDEFLRWALDAPGRDARSLRWERVRRLAGGGALRPYEAELARVDGRGDPLR